MHRKSLFDGFLAGTMTVAFVTLAWYALSVTGVLDGAIPAGIGSADFVSLKPAQESGMPPRAGHAGGKPVPVEPE